MGANLECGSLLPLSARLLAGALGAGSKLPAEKAGASSPPRKREQAPALQIDATLTWPWLSLPGVRQSPTTVR